MIRINQKIKASEKLIRNNLGTRAKVSLGCASELNIIFLEIKIQNHSLSMEKGTKYVGLSYLKLNPKM